MVTKQTPSESSRRIGRTHFLDKINRDEYNCNTREITDEIYVHTNTLTTHIPSKFTTTSLTYTN